MPFPFLTPCLEHSDTCGNCNCRGTHYVMCLYHAPPSQPLLSQTCLSSSAVTPLPEKICTNLANTASPDFPKQMSHLVKTAPLPTHLGKVALATSMWRMTKTQFVAACPLPSLCLWKSLSRSPWRGRGGPAPPS